MGTRNLRRDAIRPIDPVQTGTKPLNASRPPILQVIPRLDAGGAERTTIDIAAALAKAGHTALVASEGGRMERELSAVGAEFISLPVASKNPLTVFANARRLSAVIREYGVGLIHARSRAPAWSAFLAAKRTGIPFVTTHHGTFKATNSLKRFYNSVMVRGDAVIANSRWTAEHLESVHSVAPKRVEIIPRGIDLKKFDPSRVPRYQIDAVRENWQAADGERIVLLPGRLTRWKGQIVLVDALAYLARDERLPKDIRAVIAGDSQGRRDYVEELQAAIAKAGLVHQIVIAEHIRDMAPAYLATDIVVSASTEPEAFGRIPVEAAAMGLPVIATDHGGARETVLAGESGILVPPGDAPALGEALAALLALPPEKRAEMGAKGRAYAAQHFTVEAMCARTLALYDDLIGATAKS